MCKSTLIYRPPERPPAPFSDCPGIPPYGRSSNSNGFCCSPQPDKNPKGLSPAFLTTVAVTDFASRHDPFVNGQRLTVNLFVNHFFTHSRTKPVMLTMLTI